MPKVKTLTGNLIRKGNFYYTNFPIKVVATYNSAGTFIDKIEVTITNPAGSNNKVYWDTNSCYIAVTTDQNTNGFGSMSLWFKKFTEGDAVSSITEKVENLTTSASPILDKGDNLSVGIYNTGVSAFPSSITNVKVETTGSSTSSENVTENYSVIDNNYNLTNFVNANVYIRKN